MQVKDIMTTDLVTLKASDSLLKARQIMEEKRIRQIPIVNGEDGIEGLVTKRDIYAASLSSLTRNAERKREFLESTTPLKEIMITEVHTVSPEESLAAVAVKLQELRVGAIPVTENDKLVGLISSSDFLSIVVQLLDK